MKYVHLLWIAGACLSAPALANTLFDAVPSNISFIDNNFDSGTVNTLTGSPGALVFTQTGDNNNTAGFTSTDAINTLLGRALTTNDTVTFAATISGMTGDIRANGIEFGMSPNATGFRPTDNFLFKIMPDGDICTLSGNTLPVDNSVADFGVTEACLYDGFGITLTATPAGWTFALTDVILTAGTSATFSGSFTGTQFIDHFTGGHFYITSQKAGSQDIVMNISEASMVSGNYEPVPVIHSFSADTHRVSTNGTAVTLFWNVSDASFLSISPDLGNVMPVTVDGIGQTSVVINAATTYTLTASNATGAESTDLIFHLPQEKPNILLLLVDDYGPMDTSEPFAYTAYNDTGTPVVTAFNNFYHTPNIETLADQGMKFTQAYALPMCSPTRVSLMTGFNSPRHGVTVHLNGLHAIDNYEFTVPTHRGPNNWRYLGMDGTDVALPGLMQEAGYHTFFVGKDHMSYTQNPDALGFDVADAALYKSTVLTPKAETMLEDAVAEDEPFFGFVSYQDVHKTFYYASDYTNDYSAGYNTSHKKFATMVESVDNSVGQIMAKLTELGVAEDTLVIFLGDNGSDSPALSPEAYAYGTAFDDYPIRGKKASAYEGGTRIPLIVTWGAANTNNVFQQALPIAADSVEHDMVHVVDLTVSILSVVGADIPSMDGYDLSPYWRSEAGTHRPQKLLTFMPHEHRSDYFLWYREGDWKIIYRFHTDLFELYNLANDPDESDNLTSAQPERVLTMARAMAQELDDSWGIYGELWPVLNPEQIEIPDRPLEDDPFVISYAIDGRGAIDSDGDGLTDAQEDPNADGLVGPSETDADDADSDGDGSDDYTELRLNLDPRNAEERFSAQMEPIEPSTLQFTWPSASGTIFNVLSSTNLTVPVESWTVAVSNIPAHAVSNETSQSLLISNDDVEYFRVELIAD